MQAKHFLVFVVAICFCVSSASADEKVDKAESRKHTAGSDQVIAIDVLIKPDATMVAKAKAVNAKLRADYPQGYTVGGEHVPHITLVHCYIRKSDLASVADAVARALKDHKMAAWQLTAT